VWASLTRFGWGDRDSKPDPGGAGVEGALATVCADLAQMAIGDVADPVRLLGELRHDLDLESAAGFPAFTNYTTGFKDCLDYVLVQRARFQVLAVAPFPSEQVLSAAVALPSSVFPSDHVSVMVDLKMI